MAARQSVTGHSTGTSSSYRPSSSDSSTHSTPPPSAAVRSLRPLNKAQIPSSSRVRPSTASSSAWAPTFSVSDSQMLNEHTVMSAEGFVAIPKSPTTETSANMTSIASAVAAGKEKKEKEKGKKRAKVFALGRLMVKEVLGGGGNGNTPVQKEVIASNGKVPSYGRGGAARPKYQTTLLVPPTPSSAQSAEDSLQAQALRRTLTPLSAPHLPTHTPLSPRQDSPTTTRYPPAPATVGPTTTRFSTHRPSLTPRPPPPPSTVGSESVVSAPQYYGEYHHSRPQPQYPRPHQHQPQHQTQHVRRKSSLSLQSATTLNTSASSSSASFSAKTPSTAQTSPWVGSPLAASGQPCYPSNVPVDGPYTSRRRSMSASDINRSAEDAMREGDPYGQHLQPQHQVYGNPLLAPSHLAPLSAEHLDSFVPPVQRKHSMQELQTVRGPRPRPSALSFGGAAAAASRPLIPNVVIDHGTPLEEELDGRFASARPTSPPVARDTNSNKRASRPLPKTNARGGVSGAVGNEDDPEWVLSESVTVVGFPTTQSSDSFQFDTKEGVTRSASSLGTASPAPSATPTAGSRRESRSARAPGGVEVQVVREEWSSVPEQDEEDSDEVEIVEDAAPRVQGVVPKAAMAATTVQPSPAPYAPNQQPGSREFPVQPFPPPYGAPLPQMQPYLQQASLPQMQGLPMHQTSAPAMANLLAAPHLAALLPQLGAGMVPQPQATNPTQNLLAGLAPLLAANQAAMLQQQQQYQQPQQQYQQPQQQYQQPQQQYQQPQQLQQALELYLALANMNLALSAEQMRNAPSDSQ
ncbi:hypothetical protein FRC00_003676 [Tulasnella sp. 408]|nr:hypothetical protein FRC00_003676 [Tulasnella sp. 408]